MTAPLITTSDGKKMGKSEGGAMWLNADMLQPYDYWQFWRNTNDADVGRFLKLFTELPVDKCNELAAFEGAKINDAKKVLADECTRMLHGEDVLASIHSTAATLFDGAAGSLDDLPKTAITAAQAGEGVFVVDMIVALGFAKSKNEVRKLIEGGGARVNGEVISKFDTKVCPGHFKASFTPLSMPSRIPMVREGPPSMISAILIPDLGVPHRSPRTC